MQECSKAEYLKAISQPWATKRQMDTKRTTTVVWSVCGVEVAEKVVLYSRGKVTQESYYCKGGEHVS